MFLDSVRQRKINSSVFKSLYSGVLLSSNSLVNTLVKPKSSYYFIPSSIKLIIIRNTYFYFIVTVNDF